MNNDLVNLFASTTIPIVMVGRDLCIRRFTAPAERVMNLIERLQRRPADQQHPTEHRVPRTGAADCRDRDSAPQDHEVQYGDRRGMGADSPVYHHRQPDRRRRSGRGRYRRMKRLSEKVRLSGEYANAIIEAIWQPLVVLDADLKDSAANGSVLSHVPVVARSGRGAC